MYYTTCWKLLLIFFSASERRFCACAEELFSFLLFSPISLIYYILTMLTTLIHILLLNLKEEKYKIGHRSGSWARQHENL